jgi:tetratricopeptide (TPR) repeat protein
MNDRAKFKGKIKLRLPLKVRRFIHEIKIAARLASSRSKRKQHNSPHSYIHPSIYHDINPNIEPIIEPNTDERGSGGQNIFTRVIRKLGFASHRDNLEKRDSAITQPVPARDQWDRLTDRTDHRDCPPDRTDRTGARGQLASAPTAQKSGDQRADADIPADTPVVTSTAVTSILFLDGLAALLLGVLLFISPLYSFVFSQEPLPAYMLAAVAFAVHACNKIRKGKLDLFGSRLNTALFILPLLAFFSSIAAWETRGAVGLFLLLSSCFAAYWLTSSLTGFPAAARGLLLVIIAGGAAASILMLTPIVQGKIANEALYSVGALLSASYLCCTCIMSYYETMPNQPHLTTNSTTRLDSAYQTPFTTNSTSSPTNPDLNYRTPLTTSSPTGPGSNNQTSLTPNSTTSQDSNHQTPLTATSTTSESDYRTSINPIITLSDYQTPINPTKTPQQKHSKLPHKIALKTLINPTLFTAGYFLLMSITALSSVLTYTAILLGIALLLYGLTPAMRKNALGIILIQGASVFPVIRPVQESLAAGSGLSGWLWAGAGLLLSVAMLNTWHRLKKYAEPHPSKEPQTGEELDTSKEPRSSKDSRPSKEPNSSKASPAAAGYRRAPQGKLRLFWNIGWAEEFENRTTSQGKPHRGGTEDRSHFQPLRIQLQGKPHRKPLRRGTRRLRPWVIPAAAVLLSLVILISGSQNIPLLSKQTAGLQPYPLTELMLRSRDALKAMATSPGTLLLGSGGGGWPALSHLHQSFYYEAPVPGAFLQAGVELGIFGLLTFCAAWSIFINKMKQLLKTNRLGAPSITGSTSRLSPHSITPSITGSRVELSSEQKAVITSAAAGAMALGCHFILWCGFSPAASLFLFAFFGLGKCLSSRLLPQPHVKRAKTIHISFNFRRPKFLRLPAFFRKPVFIHQPKLRLPRPRLPKLIITGICLPKITLSKAFLKINIVTHFPKISLSKHRPRFKLFGQSVSSDPKGSAYRTSLRSLLRIPLAWAKAAAANSQRLTTNTARYLVVLSAAALIFTLSWGILMGERAARTTAHALEKGDIMAALHNMEKAARQDPFNSTYHKQLGMLYLERGHVEALNEEGKRGSNEQENLKKAVFHFQKGLRLSRGDVELRVLYAEALLQMGEAEEGAAQLKEALELRPLQQNLYEYLSLGCLTAGRFLLERAQTPEKASQQTTDKTQQKTVTIIPDKTRLEYPEKNPQTTPANTALLTNARSYLKAALRVPEELEKRRAHINRNHLIYWRGSPYLGITPKIQLYSGEAATLLGDWPQAVHYLSEAARDASLRPEALLWHGLVLKRTGRGQEGETLISRALQEKPELADELNNLEELLECLAFRD